MTRSDLKLRFPNATPAFLARNADPEPVAVTSSRAVLRERHLHDDIERHCREQGYFTVHSRMDMASTVAVGTPDWFILMPERKVCVLECKARGGKTTVEQNAKLAHARKLGYVAEVVDNMGDALEAMRKAREL